MAFARMTLPHVACKLALPFNAFRISMPVSMYELTVPVFSKYLGNMSAILDKAAAHCAERKIDPVVLTSARLFPDMLPFTRQITIAGDFAKGSSARLAGVEVPKYDDTETTFDELKARIAKTVAFVKALPEGAFADAESRVITITLRSEALNFGGLSYLNTFVLPNFYFHLATAYDILRHNGVPVGKSDFIGSIP